MLVELCGAPTAGKTTEACLVAEALRTHGYEVEVVSSFRPAEKSDEIGPVATAIWRLSRPVREVLALHRTAGDGKDNQLVAALMRALPPRGLAGSLRMRQYLRRLQNAWKRAVQSNQIVIFDQAFVQALASLIERCRSTSSEQVAQAFTLIPKPDLLVHVQAPREMIKARLQARLQRQSWLERLLELDTDRTLHFVTILNDLCALFDMQVRPVVSLHSSDVATREAALQAIETAFLAGMVEVRRRSTAVLAPHGGAG